MPTILSPHYGAIHIPHKIHDLTTFRHWICIKPRRCPKKLSVHFPRGDVRMDYAQRPSRWKTFSFVAN